MKAFATICFIFLFMPKAQAQTTGTEQQLEALTEVMQEDLEDDTYLQQLAYFQRHPININTVMAEDLQLFKILTPLQIQSLLAYRKLLGPFIDLHELQAVPYWDVTTIQKMLPFVSIKGAFIKSWRAQLKEGEHLLLARHSRILQQQKGYQQSLENGYAGSRDKMLLRYKYQFNNLLQYGAVAEKDAGERFLKTFKIPFDFTSFHFFVRNRGGLKALAIGDFTINMGQGLVQWQALAFKKSSEVLSIVRQSPVIRPYHGAGEFYFNRGVGATFQKGACEATLFASHRKLTANLERDSGSLFHITSFNTSGLHRTKAEIAKRHNTEQWSYGGNLTYATTVFKVGLNAVQHHFTMPLLRRQELYNLYAIKGNRWSNASLDYTYTYKNVFLFGEAAIDQKGSQAFLQGALASLHPKVDLALLYRKILPAYQTLYGNAFTESNLPTNENGFYTGLVIRPQPGWQVQAYADHYRFPWLRSRLDAPGGGNDYFVQVTLAPNKVWEAYARWRSETKTGNKRDAMGVMNTIAAFPRNTLRFHFSYKLSSSLTVRTRVESVWYDTKSTAGEKGILVYTEGLYKPSQRLNLNGRLQYFNTAGFNSRIYVYESDVLYGYSIPFFSGKGFRMYGNVSYDFSKRFTLWLRLAHTVYTDRQPVGTGLEQSNSHQRSEIKVQARYIF